MYPGSKVYEQYLKDQRRVAEKKAARQRDAHLREYERFKQDIVDVSRRRKGASSNPPNAQSCPWLMISHGKSNNIQTFYSIAHNCCLKRALPHLSKNTIYANCDNWAVITDGYSKDSEFLSCFMIHTTSMEKILLPSLEAIDYKACFLSSSPLKPDCVVAFISSMDEEGMAEEDQMGRIKLWRPYQENWIEVVTKKRLTDLITCDGNIFALQHFTRYCVMIDIHDNDIRVKQRIEMPNITRPGIIRSEDSLIGSCGNVFLVTKLWVGFAGKRIRTIQVYKLMEDKDKAKMDWIKVTDIGDRVFFIHSRLNNFSCSATQAGLKGNSIYFTGFKRDTHVYRYSLLENRIYETLPRLHVARNIKQICWLMIH